MVFLLFHLSKKYCLNFNKMIKKTIFVLLSLLFIATFSVAFLFYWGMYIPRDVSGEDVTFLIKRGESMTEIALNLEKKEIIKSSYFFIIYGKITEQGRSLMPGSYIISSATPISQIMKMFTEGGDSRFTIIEGWNLRDIAQAIEKNNYGTKEDFYILVGTPSFYENGVIKAPISGINNFEEEFEFLKELQGDIPLEGYLFPDTYFISQGTAMEDIVKIFLSNFKQKINPEIKKSIENSSMSLFEVITRASLIEKEVTSYEDKRIVAGIIENRLKKGMRLQIDATITYLTQKRSVQIPVTETRINSPYNTYFFHGLPLGPICNPGIESIKAVLKPTKSNYLYYLSKPTGETIFSETHGEHIRAKNKYLR